MSPFNYFNTSEFVVGFVQVEEVTEYETIIFK